jgi:FkbM family methyltransferase
VIIYRWGNQNGEVVVRYVNLVKNLSNWWLHFAVKFGLTEADPVIFRTRGGVEIEVPRRLMHEFKEVFLEDTYLAGMEIPLPARPIIVDVGANAGFFSLFAASLFPGATVYACEPVPANFQQLTRNRERNGKRDIFCLPMAVCNHDGEVFLNFVLEENFTTAATIVGNGEGTDKGLTVPCVTLATLFQTHGIDRCDLLKLDCEGAEFDILYGCAPEFFSRIERIAMEVHEGPHEKNDMQALAAFLESQGFVVRHRGHMLWAWRSTLS